MASVIRSAGSLDQVLIDRLYGLEPVYEPGRVDGQLGAWAEIQCPWCGEVSGTAIDLTSADRAWIEDCQVCCRPMEVAIELDARGSLRSVATRRDD